MLQVNQLLFIRAMKKKDREKKLKELFERIKTQIKEKYKFCNLYVKNLPDDITEQQLNKLFEQFGKIRSCKLAYKEFSQILQGTESFIPKVFGFICFYEKEHAREAKISLNNFQFFSNKLFIDYHQSKEERSEYLKLKMLNKIETRKVNLANSNQLLKRQINYNSSNDFLKQDSMIYRTNKAYNSIPFNNNYKGFLGEKLFNKLSKNQSFFKYSDYFSKIVGIFLDLDEEIIYKLISNDEYFIYQVNEAIKVNINLTKQLIVKYSIFY